MSRLISQFLFAALWIPVIGMAQTSSQTPAAQPSAVTAQGKLAWINVEQAILSCDEGKKEFGEIQKYVDAKNSELDGYKKDFESLKNQLNVQGSKLTDEARMDLEDQIEAKDTALQRFQQDTQKDLENRKQRVANYISKKMQAVIEKAAKERGLIAVFIFNASRDAWVDPTLYITEDIVKAYNQNYPASSPKAPAAATPAKKP